jgi:hypothetical protein
MVACGAASAEPRHIDWFAFDLDTGGGRILDHEWFFLGRTRVGYVRVRDDWFSSIGIAAETKDFGQPTFGLGASVLSLRKGFTGLVVHGAVMSSTSGDLAFELGGGWTFFRVEVQVALTDPTTYTVVAFNRLPLGAIAYKLWGE